MTRWAGFDERLGVFRSVIDVSLLRMGRAQVMKKIWNGQQDSRGTTVQMSLPERARDELATIRALADEVRAAGYEHALVLGPGGPVAAAAMMRQSFGVAEGALELDVIDTLNPSALTAWADWIDPERTLYLVCSSQAETTAELATVRFFWAHAAERIGAEAVADHFVAVAAPGSDLDRISRDHDFRAVLPAPPDHCGAFGALSTFGLLPAALVGLDLERLIEHAEIMAHACAPTVSAEQNPAARLGVILAEMARVGRDKLTLVVANEEMGQSFPRWCEQLMTEIVSESHRGILPIVDEPLSSASAYGPDRLVVCFGPTGDHTLDRALGALRDADHPLLRVNLDDPYELGGQILLWQLAAAVTSHSFGLTPASQATPTPTPQHIDASNRHHTTLDDGVVVVRGDVAAETPLEALELFLEELHPPQFVAIQAFLPPRPAITAALADLRSKIRDDRGAAVSLGYAPSLLHAAGVRSTAGGGRGRCIQITADAPRDLPVPAVLNGDGEATLGQLESSVAAQEREALLEGGWEVLQVHLGADILDSLAQLRSIWERSRSSTLPPL